MKVDMTMTCPKCDGTGSVLNPMLVGQEMRELRESNGVSLRDMAKRLELSAPYVSDLELGRRTGWNEELIKRYKAALNK